MNNLSDSCVLFFIKYPAKGKVKTRLAEKLGALAATELYKNFILDTLLTLEKLNVPFKICYPPDSAKERLTKWLGQKYSYMAQTGTDLGQRMKNALAATFNENFQRAVIIGSDLPDLPADFLTKAFNALESQNAVIGPSSDGGCYLIGFSKSSFLPEAFDNIQWNTNDVFRQTIALLNQHSLSVYILRHWSDIDTLKDLNELATRNINTDFNKSKTFTYLRQIQINTPQAGPQYEKKL